MSTVSDTARAFATMPPQIARQVHAGSGAAFRLRGGLDLGEGLTLVRQPDGYRIAHDDLLVTETFETPLQAIDTARREEG